MSRDEANTGASFERRTSGARDDDLAGQRMAGRAFWATIFILFALTLMLIGFSVLNSAKLLHPDDTETTVDRAVSAESPAEVQPDSYQVPDVSLADLVGRAAGDALDATALLMNLRIAQAYAPVYAAIPKYADFHFSVYGEYAELLQGAAGGQLGAEVDAIIGNSIDDLLLVGLENRQVEALRDIEVFYSHKFTSALSERLQEVIPAESQHLPLEEHTIKAIEGTLERVKVSMPLAGLAATAVGATALKSSVKVVVTAFFAKTAAKIAVKLGGSSAGGAAVGATVGSFLGPFGALVGGVVGGAAAWFGVDWIAISLDEYFNRDEFEAELRAIVSRQERLLLNGVEEQLNVHSTALAGQTLSAIRERGRF